MELTTSSTESTPDCQGHGRADLPAEHVLLWCPGCQWGQTAAQAGHQRRPGPRAWLPGAAPQESCSTDALAHWRCGARVISADSCCCWRCAAGSRAEQARPMLRRAVGGRAPCGARAYGLTKHEQVVSTASPAAALAMAAIPHLCSLLWSGAHEANSRMHFCARSVWNRQQAAETAVASGQSLTSCWGTLGVAALGRAPSRCSSLAEPGKRLCLACHPGATQTTPHRHAPRASRTPITSTS